MSTADMLAELLRLPAEERARLALELIRSVDAGAETGAADAWDAEGTMTLEEYRAHVRERRALPAR